MDCLVKETTQVQWRRTVPRFFGEDPGRRREGAEARVKPAAEKAGEEPGFVGE